LRRRKLLGERAGRPSIGSLQLCQVRRETGEGDRQGEDDQCNPDALGEKALAPMQACVVVPFTALG
jgi:hypothetical protein